jgi:hypothetical protein
MKRDIPACRGVIGKDGRKLDLLFVPIVRQGTVVKDRARVAQAEMPRAA